MKEVTYEVYSCSLYCTGLTESHIKDSETYGRTVILVRQSRPSRPITTSLYFLLVPLSQCTTDSTPPVRITSWSDHGQCNPGGYRTPFLGPDETLLRRVNLRPFFFFVTEVGRAHSIKGVTILPVSVGKTFTS